MKNKRINIFVSHSWKNNDDYLDIINLLKKHNIEIGNFSVSQKKSLGNNLDDLYLEQKLKNRIRNCSIFIVACNVDLINSKWVEKEVRLARIYNKYILGIRPKGQKKTFDPKYIVNAVKYRGKIINYNPGRVLQTIQNVTKIELKKSTNGKRKTKKNILEEKLKNWIKAFKYSFLAFLMILSIVKIIQFSKQNDYSIPTGNNEIINSTLSSTKYNGIIIVQKFTSLKSAIQVKNKYKRRGFEIIKTNSIDSDLGFYVAIIDIKDQRLAERKLAKITLKKAEWKEAQLLPTNKVCPQGLERKGNIFECS